MHRSVTRRFAALLVMTGLLVPPLSPVVAAGALTEAQVQDLEMQDFRQVINGAKGKVFPAVVFIKCLSENYDAGKKVTVEASGSGVLISATGEVLTNWHVVDKAVEVRCLLYDGRARDAKVVGTDKDTDLALLQIKLNDEEDQAQPLPFAKIGDSAKLGEGHFVMAMGAPWGLSRSISMGIVSCTRRFLPDTSEYSLWLQTDAAISPGNSGGPLVNTDGEVVGINARGMMAGGDMGFAIPSETVKAIVPQLRKHGRVEWSWTGLQLQPIRDFNRDIYFEGTDGVVVSDTDPESPARQAGLQPRDRILKVNGVTTTALMEEDLPAVRRMLGLLPKDKPAKIEVRRDEKVTVVELTPREKGKVQGEELDCPRWDVTVKAINQFENPDLFFNRKQGVFVHGVRYPGNAAASGLQNQDILVKIDGKEVKSLDDVKAIHKATLADEEGEHRVLITVLRNGLMKQIVLDFSRDHAKE